MCTGSAREKWLLSICKEIEKFLLNMTDADPSLVVKFKSMGKWSLPCLMVFVLKALTQTQQNEHEAHQNYKHKSRLAICGNFAAWGEHSTTTTNLDAPLLRLMLSLATAQDTTWSSIDITSAFLKADIHEDDTVLVTPPPILVKMNIVKPNTVWRVKKVICGLREALRLWQGERDQQWKTSTPEHLGPDPDCVPVLRFLGMNFERVDNVRIQELSLPEGSIVVSQMGYIVEVLMKFEPSLQLKTRTTPGNQESFATRPKSSPKQPTPEEQAEYLDARYALI